jgi:acyl-CoA synthetase (AMP-forming)/AMP-acid ligase II
MTGRWDGTTLRWPDDPMLGPGSPFEIVEETVLGETTMVFRERLRSYRELVEQATAYGDREAFVFGDRRITYAQHGAMVAGVAHGLATRFKIGPGDRVALFGANTAEWVIAFGAITTLGATAVALNGWWTAPEAEYALDLTRPRLLLADAKRAARLRPQSLSVAFASLEDVVAEFGVDTATLCDQPIAEDDPAVILFTSGTTGRPKGATSSHRNLLMLATNTSFNQLRSATQYPDYVPAYPPCTLAQLPLFHVSGLHGSLVHCLSLGQKSVWPLGRFDERTVLRLTEEERITTWSVVATQLLRLLEHPDFDHYDLSSLGFVGGGGSAWSLELLRRVRTQLPQVVPAMSFGFGLTESSGMGTVNIGSTVITNPDSVGAPRPTCEVQVRDLEGVAVPEGAEGEIYLRGPCIMLGYYDNPEATAYSIVEGRWLRTGDLGWIRDGLLYIAARRTDLIIRGAENIYPIEIEHRLMEHPSVADAAVFGVADRVLGQEVHAVVQRRADTAPTADELREWVAEGLASFKVPTTITVLDDALPRNATGKVLKHVLRGDAENTFLDD